MNFQQPSVTAAELEATGTIIAQGFGLSDSKLTFAFHHIPAGWAVLEGSASLMLFKSMTSLTALFLSLTAAGIFLTYQFVITTS